MFKTFYNAFKIKDIRKKILMTLLLIVIYRLGCFIPIPGVNGELIAQATADYEILGFLNLLSGSAFSQVTLFAMGISPYITASIILQLLTIAIPALERISKEEDGRQKIEKITRATGIGLAFVQSIGIIASLGSGALININLSEEGNAFLSGDFFAHLGGIEGKQAVELTETFFKNSETSDPEMDSVASMRLVAAVIARELDYSIMNEVGYDHYKDQSVLVSLEEALSPALLEQIRDDIVYYTDEENGTTCPQAVNITQWLFVRDCVEAKGEVYLTFSNGAESMEQNDMFLSYLLGWQSGNV